MVHRYSRYLYAVLLLVFLASTALPAWAVLPTPTQPILIVQNSGSTDRYQGFVSELLRTEGLNGFQTAQLTELTASFLNNYDVVILPRLTLTTAQTTLFQNYVNAGGTLVGFRPDLKLAGVFGVSSLGTTLSEAWLKIDTATPYTSALESQVMRYHGIADLYSLNGAASLATLYASTTSATASPAAAIYTFGQGMAILFAFDLTQSIVLMRQGNPAWAGYPNTHDGFNTMRPSQMFMDEDSGQFWNDLGDGELNDVPQADIQLRLFSNALMVSNTAKRPLPRFWYFPSQNRAMLLMTGDHHGDSVANSINETNAVESFGGQFTNFLWYPFGAISNAQVNSWISDGHTIGVHFDATAQTDSSGVGGSGVTWNGMQSVINTALSSFASNYPGAPSPTVTRNHWLIWLSRNSSGVADQTAQAKLFQNAGIEMDTSFSAFPKRWGYMTGSGLPMKFLDTSTGAVIPVFEQATQYEDDIQIGNVDYALNWDFSTAQARYQKSLSDSLTKYNTVVTMLFHPDRWSQNSNLGQSAMQFAQTNSIPIYSTGAWLQFWKARAATSVTKPSFTSNTLSFTVTGAPAGVTLQVPHASGTNKVVSSFSVDGVSQNYAVALYQGVTYASVNLTAGTHNISVTYADAGRILGQISPSAAALGTTVQVQSTSFSQTVSVESDGTYAVGPLSPDSYTVTPSSSEYSFSPNSQPVTVGATDVTNVNFTATALQLGQTLFTTQVPALPSVTDGVQEELGMKFTSTTAGQIIAVRFWKGSSEIGTHVGKIWSGAGQLLASVTFSNETPSGWQRQNLPTPVNIPANTQFVVSVNTSNTFFAFTQGGLASQIVNGDLRSVVGNNGVWGLAGQFPADSYENSNYFRDIAFVSGFGISGTISPVANGAGTTLTLSGPSSATATADVAGNYNFNGLANGAYTVTPSKPFFFFTPASAVATVSDGGVSGLNFTIEPLPTYSISGTISPAANGSGATVTLSGPAGATTTADASGNFTFTGLYNGSYTVTPSKSLFMFTPATAPATVNNANVTGVNFTIEPIPTYTISGAISPAANGSGATVTLSGAASATTSADASGNFSFSGLYNGSYTVTPAKTGFNISPANAPATINNANVTGIAFTATAAPPQTLFTTQTPAQTNQTDGVNEELGMKFTSSAAGQIVAIRFWKGTSETGTHVGRIWSSTGTLLASVTFTGETASGWQQQALPTPLAIAASTQYVVSVSTSNAFFVVSTNGLGTQIVNGNLASVVANNGVWGLAGQFPANTYQNSNYFRDIVFQVGSTYSISGAITPAGSGGGTTVTLSGAADASTTADASGNFTFTGLPNGSYTVTPSKTGFAFSPSSAPVTVNSGNLTGVNFTATPVPTYSISGTITPASSGSGATVTLSGAAGASTTADASGNFTFTGLANGSYSVTPSKTGFTFNPVNAPVTINNADVTGIAFTASGAAPQSLFTTQLPVTLSDTDGIQEELGMKFTSSASGQITALRFYKGPNEVGTHVGRIWSITGTLLASVTFTGETASGWQQQALAVPLAITAGTQYIISVGTSNNLFVATINGLNTQVVNGNLSSVVGSNGVWGPAGQFPANSYQNSNYFRDVVFVAN